LPSEVPVYEASYTYKQSKFGLLSPITPYNPKKTKDFAALYRERIYFFSNQKERQRFLLEPSQFVMEDKEAFPADVTAVPRCAVIGLPASGKTDLCKKIQEVTGAVHL
jgi:YHS domain-containing protein